MKQALFGKFRGDESRPWRCMFLLERATEICSLAEIGVTTKFHITWFEYWLAEEEMNDDKYIISSTNPSSSSDLYYLALYRSTTPWRNSQSMLFTRPREKEDVRSSASRCSVVNLYILIVSVVESLLNASILDLYSFPSRILIIVFE